MISTLACRAACGGLGQAALRRKSLFAIEKNPVRRIMLPRCGCVIHNSETDA